MTTLLDFIRAHLSPEGVRTFSEQAFFWAGQSQEERYAALVLVASGSLLVVVLWLAAVAWIWRVVSTFREERDG